MLSELQDVVNEIRREKYPQASALFFAGSLVRGEGTSTSDLDLVVLFDHIPCAYRESFSYKQWPVEAFVHDPSTLEYFFREVDRPTGYPSLPSMVAEGIEIPQSSELSKSMKNLAAEVLSEGPPKWSKLELDNSRYAITNLIDDLKDPRSTIEMQATASQLYGVLGNHYLRSRQLWSAKGKTLPRRLIAINREFAQRYSRSFETLFLKNLTTEVVELAAEILKPDGGFLFEGYKLEAPKSWRINRSRT